LDWEFWILDLKRTWFLVQSKIANLKSKMDMASGSAQGLSCELR